MKYVDADHMDDLPGIRLRPGDTFSFQCHPGLDCFNLCCRNLNLFLYPYDLIRLKNNLKVTSDQFLDTYVDVVLRPGNFFPEVMLRMSDNAEKTCPFLTNDGCSVYPDRPDTCRTFPLEQGAFYNAKTRETEPLYFFRPPDFCLGQHEQQALTLQTWANDQEAERYNKMTARWAELKRLFQDDPWGSGGPEGPRGKMAFMATYNMDAFRDFIFNSSFRKRYKVKSKLLKKAKKDDTALLTLGFEWVKLYLWGIKTKTISQCV